MCSLIQLKNNRLVGPDNPLFTERLKYNNAANTYPVSNRPSLYFSFCTSNTGHCSSPLLFPSHAHLVHLPFFCLLSIHAYRTKMPRLSITPSRIEALIPEIDIATEYLMSSAPTVELVPNRHVLLFLKSLGKLSTIRMLH